MHHWLAGMDPSVTISLRSMSWCLYLKSVFELPGVLGVEPPYLTLSTPYLWSKLDPGGRVSTLHLSFAEVCMLLYSHFLLMQFLKYLQRDDLKVTTS